MRQRLDLFRGGRRGLFAFAIDLIQIIFLQSAFATRREGGKRSGGRGAPNVRPLWGETALVI